MKKPDPTGSDKEIFFAALDQPTAEARGAYLDRACANDPARRARVEALLVDHFRQDSFMRETAAQTAVSNPEGAEGPGSMVGPYKLLQVIGEGGCGIVYMAEQSQPIRRRVAL